MRLAQGDMKLELNICSRLVEIKKLASLQALAAVSESALRLAGTKFWTGAVEVCCQAVYE